MNSDTYQIVTDRIIAKLNEGTIPWRHFASSPLAEPKNLVSKKPYRGINHFLLTGSKYGSDKWLTYKQAQDLGGNVRRGEKSEMVVFWKFLERDDDKTGKTKQIPMLRHYSVFNVEQCDGVEYDKLPSESPRESSPLTLAEEIVAAMPNRPRVVIDKLPKAFYSSTEDYVHMTERSACVSDSAYYSTLLHELIHSTGHHSRLNRFEQDRCDHHFGSRSYACEELVAEMGAAMLCAGCQIFEETEENTVAYIQSWIGKLKEDKTLIVKAAGKAQKASDFVLGRSYSSE